MDHTLKLREVQSSIESLMEDTSFIDQLKGEDESFLSTVWDFIDRLAFEFDPEVTIVVQAEPNWELQQDADID